MVEEIAADLSRPFGVDLAIHYELPPSSPALRLHSAPGVPAPYLGTLRELPVGEAVCGRVAERAQPEAHARVDTDPDERLSLARELGVTAYASFPLGSRGNVLGTLSLGSRTRAAFEQSELFVLGLAADLVTVAAARERDAAALDSALAAGAKAMERTANLERALVTNRVIAMAIGIVMARTGRTEQQAHLWLTEASQRTNRKMLALAEGIVHTGSLEL
nr:GAF and ANTAR domain-containing protein [Modestobacter versicolor]